MDLKKLYGFFHLLFLFSYLIAFEEIELEKNINLSVSSFWKEDPSAQIDLKINPINGKLIFFDPHTYQITHSSAQQKLIYSPSNMGQNISPLATFWDFPLKLEIGLSSDSGNEDFFSGLVKEFSFKERFGLELSFIFTPTSSSNGNEKKLSQNTCYKIKNIPQGYTNISYGNISGTNHIHNYEVYLEKDFLMIVDGSGTKRKYIPLNSKKNQKSTKKPPFFLYIKEEILPSGYTRIYTWDEENKELKKIETFNTSQQKACHEVSFSYEAASQFIKTSKGQESKLAYNCSKNKYGIKSYYYELSSKEEKNFIPFLHFQYREFELFNDLKNEISHGIRKEQFQIEYSSFDDYEIYKKEAEPFSFVKSINKSFKKEENFLLYQEFRYHPHSLEDQYTDSIDAYGNLTRYRYGSDHRIFSIEFFDNNAIQPKLFGKERYLWGKEKNEGNLICKWVEDEIGNTIYARFFEYDESYNVTRETLIGNLTGKHKNNLRAQFRQGTNYFSEGETYSTYFTYSQDGLNLLVEKVDDFGCKESFRYKPGTNLLTDHFIWLENEIGKRTHVEYNENHFISKIIKDDGSSEDINDYQNVSKRIIVELKYKDSINAPTEPTEIIYKYYDFTSCSEKQLKRNVLEYQKGKVCKVSCYDSLDNFIFFNSFKYDDRGNCLLQEDSSGRKIENYFDNNDQLVSQVVVDSNLKINYFYDLNNQLIKKVFVSPTGETLTEELDYDLVGNKIQIVDILGQKRHYKYDFLNRVIGESMPPIYNFDGVPIIPIKEYQRDIMGNIVFEKGPNGYVTRTSYNSRNQKTKVEYPDGSFDFFEYDLRGRLIRKMEKQGLVTEYQYNLFDQVMATREIADGNVALQKFVYKGDNLISRQDKNGNWIHYEYDGAGRKIKEKQIPKGLSEESGYYFEWEYNPQGLEYQIRKFYNSSKEESVVEEKHYDVWENCTANIQMSEIGHFKVEKRFEYNSAGKCIKSILFDPDKKEHSIERFEYDTLGHLISKIDPLGNKTSYQHVYGYCPGIQRNAYFRTTIDPFGNQKVEIFEQKEKLVALDCLDADGELIHSIRKYYDPAGNKVQEVDINLINGEEIKKVYTWLFGPNNRIEEQTELRGHELERVTRYVYNSIGQLESKIKPDQITIHYEYDGYGRKKHVYSNDKTVSYVYHYDQMDHIVLVEDLINQCDVYREYDVIGRMVEEKICGCNPIQYDYDRMGQLTKIIYPDKTGVIYDYQGLFLRQIARTDQDDVHQYIHTYNQYDSKGFLKSVTTAIKDITISYNFDLCGRPNLISSEKFFQEINQYDPIGNMIKMTIKDPIHLDGKEYKFEYDSFYRIIKETGQMGYEYTYDCLNNRYSKNNPLTEDSERYEYNALNQLLSDGALCFDYDVNGNITEVIRNNRIQQKYQYDALDRMTSAIVYDGNTTIYINYFYDAFNRRVLKKKEVTKLNRKIKFHNQYYLYHREKDIGMMEEGKIKELKIFGLENQGAGSEVAIELEGALYIPFYDVKGSVRAMISSGSWYTESENYDYNTFGETLIYQTGFMIAQRQDSFIKNPWMFLSKRFDTETGLIFWDKRYYYPKIGRWISVDPDKDFQEQNPYICNRL